MFGVRGFRGSRVQRFEGSGFGVCVFVLCASRFAFGYAGQVAAQAGGWGLRGMGIDAKDARHEPLDFGGSFT